MGEQLSRKTNCGCLNDLFYMLKTISKSKIELKSKQMENEFELKEGILIFFKGSHYSNANITDKKTLEILKEFPIKINAFVRYPKNWKELIKDKEVKAPKKEAKELATEETKEVKTEENKELELLSDIELRELCTKLADSIEGLKKLNHKAGKAKMINYLITNKVNG